MSDHDHGKMEIETQEKTFEGFIKLVGYAAVFCVGLLIFLALANG